MRKFTIADGKNPPPKHYYTFQAGQKQMKRGSSIFKIRKYHLNIVLTNVLALVIANTFIKSYKLKGISIFPLLFITLFLLLAFIGISLYILQPLGKIKKIFPDKKLVYLNIAISMIINLIMIKDIQFDGFLFSLLFAFFLWESEHLIYEGAVK